MMEDYGFFCTAELVINLENMPIPNTIGIASTIQKDILGNIIFDLEKLGI